MKTNMSETLYDLAIIGAGPGGYHAAIRAAQYGAKVALIEKAKLGGTCLNWGCIPTKALYASAHLIEQMKEADEFGIEVSGIKPNFAKAVERKNKIVEELVNGIGQLENAWKNDVYKGFGKVVGGNSNSGFEISIQGEKDIEIKAKRVIIATGSSPALIPAFNIDHDKINDYSDSRITVELLSTERLNIPLGIEGNMFVDDSYLDFILTLANESIFEAKTKVHKLEKILKSQLK